MKKIDSIILKDRLNLSNRKIKSIECPDCICFAISNDKRYLCRNVVIEPSITNALITNNKNEVNIAIKTYLN